jgi:NADH-quinone oxidoreductase subunit C
MSNETNNPNQPLLDKIVKVVTSQLGADVLEESYINELSENIPTLVIKNSAFHDVAKLMKEHPELAFDYMGLSLGVDHETHMESIN